MVAGALLWLAVAALGGAGHWLAALLALLPLLLTYGVLGARREGRADRLGRELEAQLRRAREPDLGTELGDLAPGAAPPSVMT